MSLHAGTRRALLSTQAGGTSGLLNALIAYWPGNEANGNALDLHTNALHLTDVNTVTSNPGKVYALARQYTAVNNEYHTRAGDDVLLSTGDVDFTVACWVYMDFVGTQVFVAKDGVINNREFTLYYSGSTINRFRFQVFDGLTTLRASAHADTLGLPMASNWYLLIGWHDATANIAGISVNQLTDTVATSGAVGDGTAPFRIGAHTSAYTNGRIGPTMFWKSAAGGGGVLTAAQRTALYNGGEGLRYDQFTL